MMLAEAGRTRELPTPTADAARRPPWPASWPELHDVRDAPPWGWWHGPEHWAYLTRQGPQRKLNEDTAKVGGLDLMSTMDRRMREHPDAEFVKKVTAARDDVQAALDQGAAAIAGAVTTASKALTDELAALQARATEVATELEALRAAIGTGWTLPPAVQAVVVAETQQLTTIAASLRAGRIGEAKDRLGQRSDALRAKLHTEYAPWRDAATALIQHATDPSAHSLALADPGLSAAAAEASTALSAVGSEGNAPIGVILERIDAAMAALGEFLVELRVSASAVASDVRAALRGAPAVDAALGPLLDALGTGRDAADVRAILAALKALESAMAAAVRAKGPPSTEIDSTLAEGRYADAAKAASAAVDPVMLKSGASGVATASSVAARRRVHASRAPGMRLPELPTAGPATAPAADQATRLRHGIGVTRTWQDALIALSVIIAGYLLFADGWTGSTDDILQVLAWAFAVDFSVVFVQTALKRPHAPGAAIPPAPNA